MNKILLSMIFLGTYTVVAMEKIEMTDLNADMHQQKRTEIVNNVKIILSEQLYIALNEITLADSLVSLGADSLDHVAIMRQLEETFAVKIDESQEVATVQDIVDLIICLKAI